ncbi:hypothetical protein SAMN05660706_12124 [Desulfoscipio geothermicus DSM 3669]|uniref:Uncharacterized protein n=2 Tax=Desulfoscipio geothermicus TaxID=39060 RepID=A0A1I6DY92_9FIRM|nr:hypothetical protein SAMN05660706_12124 [Desulfoscipio geothermicus DSM 3669]
MHAKEIWADVVVLDPPRKGCDRVLLDTVTSMKPERIVYLDMCFLFPVFIIIAIMATKKRRLRFIIDFHYLYLGTLLFSVALGGILKPAL